MKNLSDEELRNHAHKNAEEFMNKTPIEEMFKLEKRICILHFILPKIMWHALEGYSKVEEISVNELLTTLCNEYLIKHDRQIAMAAALSAGLQSGIDD